MIVTLDDYPLVTKTRTILHPMKKARFINIVPKSWSNEKLINGGRSS